MSVLRRKSRARLRLIAATILAGAAAFVAWSLLLKESKSPTEDELREIEAFEEYERGKKSATS